MEEFREQQKKWLLSATQNVDAWLRHPSSLEMMRRHVESLIEHHPRVKPDATQSMPTQARAYLGVTPREVVWEKDGSQIYHYGNRSGDSRTEPLLICYSLINRPYILDFQPQRSVIRQLSDAGINVYLLDWGTPGPADCHDDLSDYVLVRLHQAAEFVCQHGKSEQLSLMGYCLGGTMAAMYTATHSERIGNLLLMAAPIDTYAGQGLLQLWADPTYFDVDRLVDTLGNCPGELLQFCFQMLRPVQNFYEKYATLAEKLDDEDYLVDFQALERWTTDSVPVAGAAFRQIIKQLYRENLLAQNRFPMHGQRVDLKKIDRPLLMLTADKDHLVPPASTLALANLVVSSDINRLSVDCGHVGLAVGRKAHRKLWPKVCNWLATHLPATDVRVGGAESLADSKNNKTQNFNLTQARNAQMSEQNTLDALRRSSFFQDVADEYLEPLANIARIEEYPAKTNIFEEFEKAKDVFIVLSGEVSVVVCEPKVGCRQLASVSSGELLGWSSLLERDRMSATAYTLIPTKVIVIDGHQFHEMCQQQPALGYEIMSRAAQVLSERLYATRVQLLEMSGVHLPEVTLESD